MRRWVHVRTYTLDQALINTAWRVARRVIYIERGMQLHGRQVMGGLDSAREIRGQEGFKV